MTTTHYPKLTLSIAFYIDSVPFTRDVIEGRTSLGGSESACIGTAQGLARRGHDVHIFATKLADGVEGEDGGVQWHPAEYMHDALKFHTFDVFCSLRMAEPFKQYIPAKWSMYWAQDLLMSNDQIDPVLSQVDELVFVSEYHRKQWGGVSKLVGQIPTWMTRNGIDLELAYGARMTAKFPYRCIYISRPERGVDGLLKVWPLIRAAVPAATLTYCRYSSMYDAGGWGQVVKEYDRRMQQMNAEVGGVTFLGELDKVDLYDHIAQSAIMLYPTSQPNFAETNCIAATEAQACGTPMVGSWRGALPETLAPGAGFLLPDDPLTDAGAREWTQQVIDVLTGNDEGYTVLGDGYKEMQEAGYKQVEACDFDVVAEEWEGHIVEKFTERYEGNRVKVMRQLLHWDNHAAAAQCAQDIMRSELDQQGDGSVTAAYKEAHEAAALCHRVMRQEEQTAEHYAKYACQDPMTEAQGNTRLERAAQVLLLKLSMGKYGDKTQEEIRQLPLRILDWACGNGSMALVLAAMFPNAVIYGFDYSPGVLLLAKEALLRAEGKGVFFEHDLTEPGPLPSDFQGPFDAAFCGEFLEHLQYPDKLISRLNQLVDGPVVLTTPCGPFAELLSRGVPRQRGHIHSFTQRDLARLFKDRPGWSWEYLDIGQSPRGNNVGYWVLGFDGAGKPTEQNGPTLGHAMTEAHYWHTILTERPYQSLHCTMIVRDGEEWLTRCLNSIYQICDFIHVGVDRRTQDWTIDVLERYRVFTYDKENIDVHGEWFTLEWPGDFSAARNIVLDHAIDAGADWVLWIDADEHIDHQHTPIIPRHLRPSSPFLGYAVKQQHLEVDGVNFFDRPVRVFRTDRGIRFAGIVHEQPEMAPDQSIYPALQLEVNFIHLGYHSEPIRKMKSAQRNLPYLRKTLALHKRWEETGGAEGQKARRIDWWFVMRDYLTMAKMGQQRGGDGRLLLTPLGVEQLHRAVEYYTKHGFDKVDDRLHDEARGVYQEALLMLHLSGHGDGFIEFEWAFTSLPGGLQRGGRVKPERHWARSVKEIEEYTTAKMKRWLGQLTPATIDVEPWGGARPLIGVHALVPDIDRSVANLVDAVRSTGAVAEESPEALRVRPSAEHLCTLEFTDDAAPAIHIVKVEGPNTMVWPNSLDEPPIVLKPDTD